MATGHDALARRLLGAALASLALHGLLISSFKPVSAQYAGDPYLRTHIKSMTASLDALPPGRGGPPPLNASAGKRERSPAPRRLGEDRHSATKSYLSGWVSRPGNLPDGREATIELDMRLLKQYYTAREVDQRAMPLEEVPLYNPLVGPAPGSTAKVVILLLINERGTVDSVATLESRQPGDFSMIARTAFGSTRFSPAIKDGKPVKSQKVIEVIYGS